MPRYWASRRFCRSGRLGDDGDVHRVISLGYGDRTLDCQLDAPLIRKIGTGVTVGEEHPRHAVRLNQDVDRRHAQ